MEGHETPQDLLFNRFSKCCIQYPRMSVINLFNQFIAQQEKEDIEFMSKHFMIFIKVGEATRDTYKRRFKFHENTRTISK